MLTPTAISALKNLFSLVNIPFYIMNLNGTVELSFPEELADYVAPELNTNPPDHLGESSYPDGVTLLSIHESYNIAITKLDRNHFFATVPLSSSPTLMTSALQFVGRFKENKLRELYQVLAAAPSVEVYQIVHFASTVKFIYSGKTATGINFYRADNSATNNIYPLDSIKELKECSHELIRNQKHVSDGYLDRICDAIERGNRFLLLRAINAPMNGIVGTMSNNTILQRKYMFVICLYNAMRASIRGGLNVDAAHDFNNTCCLKMDFLKTSLEIAKYERECLLELCDKVSDSMLLKNYSHHTRDCCHYIQRHLFDQITIKDITNEIHLNRSNLSTCFKKDTGMTIKEYLNNERLHQACFMLSNYNMSISELSELLCYSNESHFILRFREKYGITPAEYRKQHYQKL